MDADSGGISWRSCLFLLVAACGGGSDVSEPVDGEPVSIHVYTSTEGDDIDPDGYSLTVDGGTPFSIGATDTLIVSDLEPGPHTVVLDGWAENCTPSTSPSRQVEAPPGEATSVHFAIACTTVPALIARVTTVGLGWDLDGYLIALDGGEAQPIAVVDTIVYGTLPAGEHEVSLSALQDNCSFEGPNPRSLSVRPGATAVAEFEVRCLAPSRILFGASVYTPDDARRLYLMSRDGMDLQQLTSGQFGSVDRYVWSPTGDRIAYTSGTDSGSVLVVMSSDGSGQTPMLTGLHWGELEWSPDAIRIAFLAVDDPQALAPDLYVVNSDGSGLTLLSRGGIPGGAPAWSPDGRKIAFEADPLGERQGLDAQQADIYLINPDGSALTRLTSADGVEHGPAWSPDGGTIAFASEQLDGTSRLYLMNSDGTNQRPLTSGFYDDQPRWSPDGSKILFIRDSERVVVMHTDGTSEVNLTPDSFGAEATWSPDGRAIAYHDRHLGIRLINPDGSGDMALPIGEFLDGLKVVSRPRWEP